MIQVLTQKCLVFLLQFIHLVDLLLEVGVLVAL